MPRCPRLLALLAAACLALPACGGGRVVNLPTERPDDPTNDGGNGLEDLLGMGLDLFGARPPADAAGLTQEQQRAVVLDGGVRRSGLNVLWELWEPLAPLPSTDGSDPSAQCAARAEAVVAAGDAPRFVEGRQWVGVPDRIVVGDRTVDGIRCYAPDAAVRALVDGFGPHGVRFTAVVYGVPTWARRACGLAASRQEFCATAPGHEADFGRFGAFLAEELSEADTFVVHNEVNTQSWYWASDALDLEATTDRYALDFNAFYDGLTAGHPSARVAISLEHHFFLGAHRDAAEDLYSGDGFLTSLVPKLGGRTWHVAMHAYAPQLGREFHARDAVDDVFVSYGSVGSIVGWLRQRYPARFAPGATPVEVHLTENGIEQVIDRDLAEPEHRPAHVSQPEDPTGELQAEALCDAYRNVLATPGIESHIYHHLRDAKDANNELAEGPHRFGLFTYDVLASEGGVVTESEMSPKPAWFRFRSMHRSDAPDCGFEFAREGFTRLVRSTVPEGHWYSSRRPPHDAVPEGAWRLSRTEASGTQPLYSCHRAGRTFVTLDPACEGERPEGPIGGAWVAAGDGRVEIFRCGVGCGGADPASCADELVTADPSCEVGDGPPSSRTHLGSLGFAYAEPLERTPPPPAGGCDAVTRLAGGNRFETNERISLEAFPPGTTVERVVLVNGDDNPGAVNPSGDPIRVQRPDAIVAGPYAARVRAPILYVHADGSLPEPTRRELTRLEPARVDVVGGEAAVPGRIFEELAEMGIHDVERLSGDAIACAVVRAGQSWSGCSDAEIEAGRGQVGASRDATAAGLAMRFTEGAPTLTHGTVTIVSGANHQLVDAVAVSPAAARAGYPLLVTTGADVLGPATEAALRVFAQNSPPAAGLDRPRAVLVGAVAASPEVAQQIEALGYEISIAQGSGRVETAIAVLLAFPDAQGDSLFVHETRVVVTSSTSTADALAASMLQLPVLLSGRDSFGTNNSLIAPQFREATVVGGEGVVSAAVEQELREIFCAP